MNKINNEEIARAVQMALEKSFQNEVTNFSYKAGNVTLKALELKEAGGNLLNGGAMIQVGHSVGKTAFGAVEDLARNDKLCTGLCIMATVCEGVAFTTRIVKIPYGARIYFCSKAASTGLMKFRNLCRNAQGKIFPC